MSIPTLSFTSYTCEIEDGIIRSSQITRVETNERPMLNFNVNGELLPSTKEYYRITINFGEDPQCPFSLDLERINGVYNVNKKVYNAQGLIRRVYSKEKNTIFFDVQNMCRKKKKPYSFSFFISVYDCGCYCNCKNKAQFFHCFHRTTTAGGKKNCVHSDCTYDTNLQKWYCPFGGTKQDCTFQYQTCFDGSKAYCYNSFIGCGECGSFCQTKKCQEISIAYCSTLNNVDCCSDA